MMDEIDWGLCYNAMVLRHRHLAAGSNGIDYNIVHSGSPHI
jgi:hypothetical protein